MKLALLFRLRDLFYSLGEAPYAVVDKQSVSGRLAFYRLATALRVGDHTGVTTKEGEVCELQLRKAFGRPERFTFTRDRRGRLHLPYALRRRML